MIGPMGRKWNWLGHFDFLGFIFRGQWGEIWKFWKENCWETFPWSKGIMNTFVNSILSDIQTGEMDQWDGKPVKTWTDWGKSHSKKSFYIKAIVLRQILLKSNSYYPIGRQPLLLGKFGFKGIQVFKDIEVKMSHEYDSSAQREDKACFVVLICTVRTVVFVNRKYFRW